MKNQITFNTRKGSLWRAVACAAVLGAVAAPTYADSGYHWGFNGAKLSGTWRATVVTYNCATLIENAPFKSTLTFGADGTLVGTTTNPAFQPGQRGPDHGFWERTGRNFYRAVSEAFINFASMPPAPPIFKRGVQRIEQGIQFTSKDSFSSEATTTFYDEAGTVLMSGCARAVAERME